MSISASRACAHSSRNEPGHSNASPALARFGQQIIYWHVAMCSCGNTTCNRGHPMILVSALIRTLRERWAIHAATHFARRYGIRVPFPMTYTDALTLDEIFVERGYALEFPFNMPGVTIVDIGAHKGFFTVFAGRNAPRAARIVSIEPCRESYDSMCRMAAANGVAAHTPLHAALGAVGGQGALVTGDSVFNHLADHNDTASGARTQPVRVITLAELFTEQAIERVDFLKMDIEGAEYDVLLGAPSSVLARIVVISMEFHGGPRESINAGSLVRHLQANGFTVLRYEYLPNDLDHNLGKIVAVRG